MVMALVYNSYVSHRSCYIDSDREDGLVTERSKEETGRQRGKRRGTGGRGGRQRTIQNISIKK